MLSRAGVRRICFAVGGVTQPFPGGLHLLRDQQTHLVQGDSLAECCHWECLYSLR